jgi:periplasmic divalent cation tolerance protein
MADTYCLILTTIGSREQAGALAELLITRRLAACVQIIPVSSVYTWKGALQKDSEHLLLIKTAARRYAEVESAIRQNHTYELPEVVQLLIERGLPAYLAWISDTTS